MAETFDTIQRDLIASLDLDRLAHFRADQMVYLRQRVMRLSADLDPNIAPHNAPMGPRILKHLEAMTECAQTIALVDKRLRPARPVLEGCCSKAQRAVCICKAAFVCPEHGEIHTGSHE
jgi:hypothetical protein